MGPPTDQESSHMSEEIERRGAGARAVLAFFAATLMLGVGGMFLWSTNSWPFVASPNPFLRTSIPLVVDAVTVLVIGLITVFLGGLSIWIWRNVPEAPQAASANIWAGALLLFVVITGGVVNVLMILLVGAGYPAVFTVFFAVFAWLIYYGNRHHIRRLAE